MMRILLVEDDQHKLERLMECVNATVDAVEVVTTRSVQGAVQAIGSSEFDLVLLDMALPSHEVTAGQSPPQSLLNGGVEVVLELAFLRRSDRIVVLTQYPEIEIEGGFVPTEEAAAALRNVYSANVTVSIYYDQNDASSWQDRLAAAIGGST